MSKADGAVKERRFICRHCGCRFKDTGDVTEHGRSIEE